MWLTLSQRTLRYETYVLPAPEENAAILYENLLRRNERLVGAHFSIGIEDAVFLRGEIPVSSVSLVEIDRALGTLYATVEQCFQGFLRIALRQPVRGLTFRSRVDVTHPRVPGWVFGESVSVRPPTRATVVT